MEEPILKKKSLIDRILKNQLFVTVTTSMLLVFIIVGSSYAIFNQDELKLTNDVVVQSGELEVTVSSTSEMVSLNYTTLGVSDEVGMAGNPYIFEVENTGGGKIAYYEVRIVDKAYEISTLPHKSLNFSIKVNDNEYTSPSNLGDNDSYIYIGNELEIGEKDTFELKLWVNEEFGKYANNKTLRASLEITLYNEEPTRNYILYDVNGGSGYIPKTSVVSKRITSMVPVREGYVFKGWSTNSNATQSEYLSNAVYNKETGTMLYAVWEVPPRLVDYIKDTYVVGTSKGLVAIDTDGALVDSESDTIREYRYSGNARYCTYTNGDATYTLNVNSDTCPNACIENGYGIYTKTSDYIVNNPDYCETELTPNETTPNEGEVKNYLDFNGEKWRIVGIFNVEKSDGTKEELVKIVKAEPISASLHSGTTYNKITAEGTTEMNLRKTGIASNYAYYYWNQSIYFGQTNYNDWTNSALQYYLNDDNGDNTSYYDTLSSEVKGMIEEVNWNIAETAYGLTANNSYAQERAETAYYEGNSAIWIGKIGTIYPSDYGYAAESSNWGITMSNYYKYASNTGSQENWYRTNAFNTLEWFMTPSRDTFNLAMDLVYDGRVNPGYVDYGGGVAAPSLYLKSSTSITGGDGSYQDSYKVA